MGSIRSFSEVLPTLAGITSPTSPLGIFISALEAANGSNQRQQDQELRQLQERQALAQSQAEQSTALERQKLAMESAQNEESRRAALRRAVARQRASFGAQGLGSQGGSSQAVLLGLFDETEDELARRSQLDDLRNRAIDLNLSQQGALNLLQATQLAERHRLGRLF